MILEEIEATATQAAGQAIPVRYLAGKARRFGDVGLALQAASGRSGDAGNDGAQAAETVASKVERAVRNLPYVTECSATSGFMNLKLDRAAVLDRVLVQGPVPEPDGSAGGVLLEHTSINPNAEPHVGRARNAVLGDALARILRARGHEVSTRYYVNDFGKQISLLHIAFDGAIPSDLPFREVLDRYVDINQRAEADPAIEEQAFRILAEAEAGNEALLTELKEIARHCLAGQLAVLARLDISYDDFDFETSFLADKQLAHIEDALRERQVLFTDEEQREVADLRQLGFERDEGRFAVLRRSTGSSMYMFRDVAYNVFKAATAGTGRNIVVLAEDHKLYMEQISLLLAAAGFDPPEVVYYSYVSLKEGKMSTRKGVVVMLGDFLDQAETKARSRVLEANPNLPDEDVATLSHLVAQAAVRFALLRSSATSTITFDLDDALKFEGSTGPYVQYAAVRCGAILTRAQGLPSRATDPAVSEELWDLTTLLDSYGATLRTAGERLAPSTVCDALLKLAKAFSRYYQQERVITNDEADPRALNVVRQVREVLSHGLTCLGITTPTRM